MNYLTVLYNPRFGDDGINPTDESLEELNRDPCKIELLNPLMEI